MMGTWVRFDFMFGLYVYARVVQLSIDRAGDNIRNELMMFFRSEGVPLPVDVLSAVNGIKSTSCLSSWNRIILLMYKIIGMRISSLWLSQDELSYINTSIERLTHLIDGTDLKRQERNKIRLALAKIEDDLAKLLPKKSVNDGRSVKHLNCQNDLGLRKFEEIVPARWLKNTTD